MNIVSYVKLHGKGELPLPLAYLGNFVLMSAALSLMLWGITANIDWEAGLLQRGIVVYGLFFTLVIYAWGAVGAFRSMLKYNGQGILYIAYPLFFLAVIRFFVFYRSVVLHFFG